MALDPSYFTWQATGEAEGFPKQPESAISQFAGRRSHVQFLTSPKKKSQT